MFKTIEEELNARVLLHKVAITKGALINEYMWKEQQADVVLPDNFLKDEAVAYADRITQQAMEKGVFNDLYNKAWETLANSIPEDFCIM